jgi:hypothetical protein
MSGPENILVHIDGEDVRVKVEMSAIGSWSARATFRGLRIESKGTTNASAVHAWRCDADRAAADRIALQEQIMKRHRDFSSFRETRGFSFIGWSVQFRDGRYVKESGTFEGHQWIAPTTSEVQAMPWRQLSDALTIATHLGGNVAEVWESLSERLICGNDR